MSIMRTSLCALYASMFLVNAHAQDQTQYSDLLVKSANLIAGNYLLPVRKDFLHQSALVRMQAALVDTELANSYGVFRQNGEDAAHPDPQKTQRLVKEMDRLFARVGQKPDALDHEYRAWLEEVFTLNEKLGVASSYGLANAALAGMLAVVNGHYEQCSQEQNVSNRIEGVGIDISLEDGQPIITYVHPRSPAARAQVSADYIILRIDGKPTQGRALTEIVSRLQGVPGSKVALTICPVDEEKDQKLQDVEITRAYNASWSGLVFYRLVTPDSKIAYLRIGTLDRDSIRDADGAVKELAARGMAGLILDLRTGWGRSIPDAAELVDRLVGGEWTLVYDGRQGLKREKRKPSPGLAYPDVPLVVLVDRETSGPRELVAAAIKAVGRGLVLGERTRGQAVGQQPFRLPGYDYELWFSSALFRTPKDEDIQHCGVRPDIEVALSDEERTVIHERLENEAEHLHRGAASGEEKYHDPHLLKAIEYLGGTRADLEEKEGEKQKVKGERE